LDTNASPASIVRTGAAPVVRRASEFYRQGSVSTTDLPIGTELLGYRIESVLGRGGMGIVYLAEDLRLKRRVALKLLSPKLADDERFRERLVAESELAAALDHPNIVPIYQAGDVDGRIFISMRYVEGSDLKRVLRDGPLSAEHTLAVVSQIASALDAAHSRGLVHRDVKPSNVLIAPGAGHEGADHVYLADFGLTKRRSEEPNAMHGAEQLMGTIEYVAPEQIRGDDVDGRADVYSLGCLLFECLTGEPPFANRSDAATLFAHLTEEPPSLPELAQVLPKALAKEPQDRYQRCRELVDDARASLGLAEAPRAHRRQFVGLAAAAVAIAAIALAVVLTRGGASRAAARVPGRLVQIDPRTNSATETLAVGQDPTGIAFGASHVWLTTAPDSNVWRIDPKTLDVIRTSVTGTPLGIAVKPGVAAGNVGSANGGVVFVIGNEGVTMVDASSGQVAAGRQTGGIANLPATVIAGGEGGIWAVASGTAYRFRSLAFGVGRADSPVALPPPVPDDNAHEGQEPAGIAVGEDSVWALGDAIDRRLWRIDPRTAQIVATIRLPFAPGGVAAGLGGVWVTAQVDDKILRIDPRTNRIAATIAVGRAPWGVVVGAGAVWTANTVDGTVSRIDPRTNRVVATVRVDADPKQLAVGDGSIWVAAVAR
jgi:YVTN family beta-propeller protein